MKKTLLIITSFLLSTTLLFSQSKVNINNLVQYGDKWFKENDDKPFTGVVFDMSKETGMKILEGKYVQGKQHGKHKEWWDNGNKKVEGIYKSGMMDGNWKSYYENGKINFECSYLNGTGEDYGKKIGLPTNGIDGNIVIWYSNGQKKGEGTIKDGKQDGLFTEWYENGQKESEGTFKDSNYFIKKQWNEDGSVKE